GIGLKPEEVAYRLHKGEDKAVVDLVSTEPLLQALEVPADPSGSFKLKFIFKEDIPPRIADPLKSTGLDLSDLQLVDENGNPTGDTAAIEVVEVKKPAGVTGRKFSELDFYEKRSVIQKYVVQKLGYQPKVEGVAETFRQKPENSDYELVFPPKN